MCNDLQLLQAMTPQRACFTFRGPFEGKEITWQAELLTLQAYYQQQLEAGVFAPHETVLLQQFIEIDSRDMEPLPIRIVHAIPEVTEASLKKTIIMVRNYKRLHRGRHAYGEEYRFGD